MSCSFSYNILGDTGKRCCWHLSHQQPPLLLTACYFIPVSYQAIFYVLILKYLTYPRDWIPHDELSESFSGMIGSRYLMCHLTKTRLWRPALKPALKACFLLFFHLPSRVLRLHWHYRIPSSPPCTAVLVELPCVFLAPPCCLSVHLP